MLDRVRSNVQSFEGVTRSVNEDCLRFISSPLSRTQFIPDSSESSPEIRPVNFTPHTSQLLKRHSKG